MIFNALAVFLSSFLLFQIQPLIGKYILPWFGGTAGVWSASLLFFQGLLTCGYFYSHWLVRKQTPKRQGIFHLALLGFTLLLLAAQAGAWNSPLLPDSFWRPENPQSPLVAVLVTLLVSVGGPYLLLAANSTLIQAWFARENPGRSPFRLYAISNAGSFLGLLAYPFWIEPVFALRNQAVLWTGLYLFFVLLIASRSWRLVRNTRRESSTFLESGSTSSIQGIDLKTYASWLGLAALASLLLVATSSRMTQEMAAIPFLWVLPLGVYLLSFLLTFSGGGWYHRIAYLVLLFGATIAYLWFVVSATAGFIFQTGTYLVLLFACTMICHGELYRLRPPSAQLTGFYLMVSLGGTLGAGVVNLLAPLLFKGFWEFQFGLGIVWVIALVFIITTPIQIHYLLRRTLTGIIGILICLVMWSLYIQSQALSQDAVFSHRDFYGLLSVKEKFAQDPENHQNVLTHGITTHGVQFLLPEKRTLPTAYYIEDSGVGIAFRRHPLRPDRLNVGVIGLGVGVLAAYGRAGDDFRFYEINPTVVDIAQGEYFSFLRDTPASYEIILGDGRLSLQREMAVSGSQGFDLLVVDAFNSDAIPTHLLTLEAFQIYLQHLDPDGILALHISNQQLDLRPVVWGLADQLDLEGRMFYIAPADIYSQPSLWILLSTNMAFLNDPEVLERGLERQADLPELRIWTDDYSNLFQIIK